MKIGVDGLSFRNPISGIGRVILETCKSFSKKGHEFFCFTPNESRDHVNLRPFVGDNLGLMPKIYGHLWSQIAVPYYAKNCDVDVFWGAGHRLPFFLSKTIPTVLTIHDLVWINQPETMHSLGPLLAKIYMPYSVARADRIMAISNATKLDLLRRFPMARDKLSVVNLGCTNFELDLDAEAPEKFAIQDNYILFVGTLEPRKNLIRLIDAYSKLSEALRSRHTLVLVGQRGWGNLELTKLLKERGLTGNIRLLGYVPDEVLASLYRHAIFLAMPSLSEGFGLPIIEAMSAGIPVLTSNCSAMPEIAGDAGLLVDPLSVDSIRSGLERLLVDSNLRIFLSSNAKKNAFKYSWDNCADGLLNLFEDAICSHKKKNL